MKADTDKFLQRPKTRSSGAVLNLTAQHLLGELPSRSVVLTFGAFLESAPDAIVVTNGEGDIVLVNSRAEKLFGYSREEMLGRKVEMLMPGRHACQHVHRRDDFMAHARQRDMASGVEILGKRKDGREIPIDISLNPFVTDGGTLVSAWIRDISEQKSTERILRNKNAELEMATRAKSTFLATMSHEIRTPLNGVLGMLELLGLTRLDAQQRESVEVIRQSSHSLLRIIDDILDYSKIEAGKLAICEEIASIKGVMHAVLNLYSGLASGKGLLLKTTFDPAISKAVWVDPLRLQQILNNFVSNAIKFTAEGSVHLSAELIEKTDDANIICFTVKDSGIGVSPENQALLFQPFTQAEAQSCRRFGGTGLGLSICRRLAEMMGGSIDMDSAPGAGTTMSLILRLPIADPAGLPDNESQGTSSGCEAILQNRRAAPTVAQAKDEGTLVLAVDDHPVNRLVLGQQLTALGYAVESADNGQEALEKWVSGHYGIVLTDCHMPVMDGYTLAASIRAIEIAKGLRRTPIIACTANAMSTEVERCFTVGMDDYLAKPLELQDVAQKLDQWLPLNPADQSSGSCFPTNCESTAPGFHPENPVDIEVLAALSRGRPTTRQLLIDLFREANDKDATDMKKAIEDRDGTAVNHLAHRIKGAAKMIGAPGLAAIAEKIESADLPLNWPLLAGTVPAFDLELRRVNAFLESQ